MTIRSRVMSVAFALGCVAAQACGGGSSSEGFSAGVPNNSLGGGSGGNGDFNGPSSGGGSGSSSGAAAQLPPEKKVEDAYQSPVATGNYVWIANPTSGRVAYIDAAKLTVSTVAAGDGPTYLAALPASNPGTDSALVINVLSHDATLLSTSGGAIASSSFPLATDVNSWTVSANGRWAIAWGDATKAQNPDPTQGFQDLSVLDLTAKTAIILVVGYRPVTVAFSSDATRAFAVTQDGISVIDLTGPLPAVSKNFPVSTNPNEDPAARDVSITPDGAYAFVRHDGQPNINIVTLSDGTLTKVTLPANATDLALSPSGDRALAVMRDMSSIAMLPVPEIVSSPTSFASVAITGETIGRAIFTSDSKSSLLFTTAAPIDRMTVLSLSAMTFATLRLYAPILAVFPTPDAQNAIVLHALGPDSGSVAQGAFSIVPVASQLPAKIQGTPAPPNAVALSPTGDRAVITIRDDVSNTFGAYLAKMPSLEVDSYPLASPPLAAGVVAGAGRAYVAQSHPEGRITFFDLQAGQARTLTGFELSSRIVDGSNP